MGRGTPEIRYAEVERETRHTRIQVVLDLDGGVRQDVSTGLGVLDELLASFAQFGALNLGVKAECDLSFGDHHMLEDVGAALGKALRESLRDTDPIVEFGSAAVPVDESLVLAAVAMTGRGGSHVELPFGRDRIGDVGSQNLTEFFREFANHAGLTLHIRTLAGSNAHHMAEAAFIAMGRAVHDATRRLELRSGK